MLAASRQDRSHGTNNATDNCESSQAVSCESSRSFLSVAAAGIAGLSLPITPTFVLPYKRYASTSLLPLAQEYVDHDQRSYGNVVKNGALPIGYQAPPDQPIDERTKGVRRLF